MHDHTWIEEAARQTTTTRLMPEDWLHPMPLADLFPRRQPLHVDLGCGKGRFLLARATGHPEVNFLGIDRMLQRIRKVDRKAVRAGCTNVRLLRMEAYYAVLYLLPSSSVEVFYIFFPDPWPKKRHHKYRLFNPPFLDALERTLRPGGVVHLATDHEPYFETMVDVVRKDARFRDVTPFVPAPEEKTDFECYYASRKAIHRLSFTTKP